VRSYVRIVTGTTSAAEDSRRGDSDPSESYSDIKFVFHRIANPTIEQTPYEKGPLVVRRGVRPRKGRRRGHHGVQKLVGREIVPSVVDSTLSDIIILGTRLHGMAE
jgi:hypothetical protein